MVQHANILLSTGKGVASVIEDGFLRSVFVPFTVPGDLCEVEIVKCLKKYYIGKLINIIKPSPHRIKPVCLSFGVCDWLNVDSEFQLVSKKQILSLLFSKLDLSPEIQVISCGSLFHYLNGQEFSSRMRVLIFITLNLMVWFLLTLVLLLTILSMIFWVMTLIF